MQWKQPKNTDKYHWTQHVTEKMHHYGLSEQKVLGVIRNPFRIETGIAQDTVAVMMPVGNIKKNSSLLQKKSAFAKVSARQLSSNGESWNQEIWVMYQLRKNESNTKAQEAIVKKISNSKDPKFQKLIKLMKLKADKLIIISAWRYPGVSPKNNPIPAEILREIEEIK